jgi:hypothetical protein
MEGFYGLFRSKAAWIMVASQVTKSGAMSTTLLMMLDAGIAIDTVKIAALAIDMYLNTCYLVSIPV